MRWLVATLILFPLAASAQGGAPMPQGFQMPSGNVFCDIEDKAIRCDVVQSSFAKPPRPRGCDTDWGHAFSVGERGASRVLCAGDTVVNRGARVLRYGERWDGVGVTCHAERTGLRCVNADGRGFELSRSTLNRF